MLSTHGKAAAAARRCQRAATPHRKATRLMRFSIIVFVWFVQENIGVISKYRARVAALQQELAAAGPSHDDPLRPEQTAGDPKP